MSPSGAIAWLKIIQKTLDEHSETSKIIALDMAIDAIRTVRELEKEQRTIENTSDIVGTAFVELENKEN